VTFSLRLPEELHAELHQIAQREDRSLTNQIHRFLREAIERDRRRQAAIERSDADDDKQRG